MEETLIKIRSHGGKEIPADALFFAPPPSSIGALFSAQTSLKKRGKLYTRRKKKIVIAIGAVIGLAIGLFISYICEIRSQFWYFFWPALGGVIGSLFGLGNAETSFFCTYVGEDGLARYKRTKMLDSPITEEILKFTDATELHVSVTKKYEDSSYTGTSYGYSWFGGNGFSIMGTYNNKDGPPLDLNDDYYFAVAAEESWSKYALEKYIASLKNNGAAEFKTQGNINAISNSPKHSFILRLGQNFLELEDLSKKDDGESHEKWGFDDLISISLNEGSIFIKFRTVKERGFLGRLLGRSKMVDSSFSYIISYWQMPNARVFSLLCRYLLPDKAFIK